MFYVSYELETQILNNISFWSGDKSGIDVMDNIDDESEQWQNGNNSYKSIVKLVAIWICSSEFVYYWLHNMLSGQ